MPKIKYIDHKFQQSSLNLLQRTNAIIDDYRRRGYELTLRQLYYQLVARDIIPNTQKEYKKLTNLITNARDAGLVDWHAIVDRTRQRTGLDDWWDPASFLNDQIRQFRIDKWRDQPHRIFVWVEKEALAGVISRACSVNHIQVDYVSCRGYMSASTLWREARNLHYLKRDNRQHPVIIHLGDHDPSGIDMTRDNIERLAQYSELIHERDFTFRRIALNWDQIEQYNPPPNPAKWTDSRAEGYIAEFGNESWELDALDPDLLVNLIRSVIAEYRDDDLWQQLTETEEIYSTQLQQVADNWQDLIQGNKDDD
ncbi:MAG: hypothetical protein IAF02_14685 [Anaerolineae bacterium]|nr:hypothetical protein [Anaerolineae bacterium]